MSTSETIYEHVSVALTLECSLQTIKDEKLVPVCLKVPYTGKQVFLHTFTSLVFQPNLENVKVKKSSVLHL